MSRASKGELLLNEIDAIIERTNNTRTSFTATKSIPNGGIETTTTVVLEDLSKKSNFSVPPPPVVSLPDSGPEKSNSIKERAKSFQQGASIPTTHTSSSSATIERTISSRFTNNGNIPATIQPLDTILEGKVPPYRKSSIVPDAIAAVQNKNLSVHLPEPSAPHTGITKAKAWPNVGSGMLRSSSEKVRITETTEQPMAHTTLATDDIPTVDEPHIDPVPVPLSVTASASTTGTSTQVPTTARNKLAAFLAATSQKQVLSQGPPSNNSNNDDTNVLKAIDTKVPIPAIEKTTIPNSASEETMTTKPQRKPSIVMNAMVQLQSKGIQGTAALPFWKRIAEEESSTTTISSVLGSVTRSADDGGEGTAVIIATSSSITNNATEAPVLRRLSRLSSGPLAARARAFENITTTPSSSSTPSDTAFVGTSIDKTTSNTTAASDPLNLITRKQTSRLTLAKFGLFGDRETKSEPTAISTKGSAGSMVNSINPSGVAAARALFASKPKTAPKGPGGCILGSTGFLPPVKPKLTPTVLKSKSSPTITEVSPDPSVPSEEEIVLQRMVLDDPEHQPLLYIEVGSYETRMGVWNVTDNAFELRFTCPSYVAIARNDKNRYDLVSGAGRMCDPMFQTFRETGVFVGNDAKYCLYDHPDAGLRGGLELQPVLIDGQIGHKIGFLMLIHHCLYRGLGMEDAYNKEMQIIFAIKMSFSRADLCLISESIFERLGCTKACFISEALLAADAYQAMYSPLKDFDQCPMEAKSLSLELYSSTSGMVVDIGARSTTVCPMYDGIIIPNAVQSCAVGGEHCTDFMELLLGAQHSEMFSSLLPRRKKLISRHIKEQYAFVASSFVDAVAEYGSFRFDRVRLPRDSMYVTTSGSKSPDRSVFGQNTNKNNHTRNGNDTVHGSGGSRSSNHDHRLEINEQKNGRTETNDSSTSSSGIHLSPTPSYRRHVDTIYPHRTDEHITITNESNVSVMTDDGDDVWRSVDGVKKDLSQRYHKYLDVTLEDAKLDISMQFSDDGSMNQNDISSNSSSPLRVAVVSSPQGSDLAFAPRSGPGGMSPAISPPTTEGLTPSIQSHSPMSTQRGEICSEGISRAEAKHAFQKFIKDKRRYMDLTTTTTDVSMDNNTEEVVSVLAAEPLHVMNVRRVYDCPLPSGAELSLSVDKERFHCCEVLFQPRMNNDDKYDEEGYNNEHSIVSTILRAVSAIDESVRSDICTRFIIFGRTALVPGLLDRLDSELRAPLRELGIDSFVLAGTEEPPRGSINEEEMIGRSSHGIYHGILDRQNSSNHNNNNNNDLNHNRDQGPIAYGTSAKSFAPSASWRGASERLKWSRDYPSLTQNIMTIDDYHEYGPDVIEHFVGF